MNWGFNWKFKEKKEKKKQTKEEQLKKALLQAAHDYMNQMPYSAEALKGPKNIRFERR